MIVKVLHSEFPEETKFRKVLFPFVSSKNFSHYHACVFKSPHSYFMNIFQLSLKTSTIILISKQMKTFFHLKGKSSAIKEQKHQRISCECEILKNNVACNFWGRKFLHLKFSPQIIISTFYSSPFTFSAFFHFRDANFSSFPFLRNA